NGDLIATETIRVEAEGNQIRHGIFRDFPTTYSRPDGSRVVVSFDVQSVVRDGASENWTTESLSNGRGCADLVSKSCGADRTAPRFESCRKNGAAAGKRFARVRRPRCLIRAN